MKKSYILFFSIILNSSLYSAIGCISNTTDTNKCCGYDNKSYHYVVCYCNCESYTQLKDRNQCIQCMHFHAEPVI